MAEFVEQRGDFIVGQQRRLAAVGRGEVAHQVGHRALQYAVDRAATVARAIHPGTAPLVGAGVQVEEETPDVLAVFLDFKQANIRVPGVEAFLLGDFDAVQALDDGKQPAEHFVDREVGAQGFLGNAVALLAQFFTVETAVPALQIGAALFGGVGLELLQVVGGKRLAALGQVTQEAQHLVAGFSHFGGQAQLGEGRITQQRGQFLTQVEDLFHHRAVIVLTGIRALVRRTGAVGRVDFFTQGAVLGVGHHRVVARKFKGDQPAVEAFGLGGSRHLRLGGVGQAGESGFIGDVFGPGLSSIQQLVGKFAAQLGQLALHLGVTFLLLRRQIDTREAEVAQGMFQDGFLRHIEAGRFGAVGQGLEGLEQCAVLAHLGGVGAQCWQAAFVSFAQLGTVTHGVEVADRAPGGAQAVIQLVHGQYQTGPCRIFALALQDAFDGKAVVGEDLFDGRLNVLGTDRRERRQVVGLQKRVVRAHGWHLG